MANAFILLQTMCLLNHDLALCSLKAACKFWASSVLRDRLVRSQFPKEQLEKVKVQMCHLTPSMEKIGVAHSVIS